jgi:hypothetical protein
MLFRLRFRVFALTMNVQNDLAQTSVIDEYVQLSP